MGDSSGSSTLSRVTVDGVEVLWRFLFAACCGGARVEGDAHVRAELSAALSAVLVRSERLVKLWCFVEFRLVIRLSCVLHVIGLQTFVPFDDTVKETEALSDGLTALFADERFARPGPPEARLWVRSVYSGFVALFLSRSMVRVDALTAGPYRAVPFECAMNTSISCVGKRAPNIGTTLHPMNMLCG